jgi:hypothetical protein
VVAVSRDSAARRKSLGAMLIKGRIGRIGASTEENQSTSKVRYLDSVGVIVSAANVLLLRQSMPTKDQLRVWDSWLVPVSRILDRLFLYCIGKTILAIWHKPK